MYKNSRRPEPSLQMYQFRSRPEELRGSSYLLVKFVGIEPRRKGNACIVQDFEKTIPVHESKTNLSTSSLEMT